MDYVVKTEVFEGPFDLLLHLIARQQVDIWQISLSRITEDYLAEVRRMQELNLEIATEFLVVAATVLEERDLLFARLLQYRAYKQVAELFGARMVEQLAYVPRQVGVDDLLVHVAPNLLAGVQPADLARLAAAAFTPAPVPEVSTEHIAPVRLTVSEAVLELAGRLRLSGPVAFESLLGRPAPTIEVVINFLALLELYKRSLIELEQTATFGAIMVSWSGDPGADPTELMIQEPE